MGYFYTFNYKFITPPTIVGIESLYFTRVLYFLPVSNLGGWLCRSNVYHKLGSIFYSEISAIPPLISIGAKSQKVGLDFRLLQSF